MYVKQIIRRKFFFFFFLKHNNTKKIINGIVFICFSHTKNRYIMCTYIFMYTIYVYLPTNNIIIILCYCRLLWDMKLSLKIFVFMVIIYAFIT